LLVLPALLSCARAPAPPPPPDFAAERAAVTQVINQNIGWAANRDTTLLFGTNAHDSTFFIQNPDSTSIVGYQAFRDMALRAWVNTDFRGVRYEIRDLRLNLSRNADVAWFSAKLDDIGMLRGRTVGWLNVRWTGVLEKQEGRWVFVQMHFSFPR